MVEINATLVAQVINFLILVVILTKVAYKPLMKILEERRAAIEGSIASAQKEREEAEAMKAEYKAQLSQARAEAQAIVAKAERTAKESRDAILADAKREQARMLASAREEIALEKQRALAELRREVVTLSTLAASKVLAENLDAQKNSALVERFIDELDKDGSGGLPC
ncbi:MAG: F0F1 ATP synthase subunit B [Selenomonadales bacterium]|nr:F0F1 ATP synthase subunit B [Selenomonadales bacterium]MBQ5636339.1 F0F1 ATP synthase subunit B [Selenomonadales bacterium]MBQ5745453.1 F0F1 ATP synthase subunit B [Selenomonadales bacterium]